MEVNSNIQEIDPYKNSKKHKHPKQKPCFWTKKLKTKPKGAKPIKGVQFSEIPSLEFCDATNNLVLWLIL